MDNEDAFYAVNKLVDFAHGETIQKQMIQSMNEAIANMRVPGVDNSMRETTRKPEEEHSHEN
ncbi:MAG: hypothetical protein LBT00_03660 [Spirochaetaceae bacterium]|jgi:hypothetical protein|nr:hypothetical protein [Spirochaetaceae bacterium]